ncbi:MAG: 50S ribosomal protein P1 [Candidatus Aenigmarchaeota archaeon]|nr:50S ribosomal protein P1 [Candidatus Aenigmarchaeota archaeon]
MNLVYAALLLHSAGKPVDETHLKKVISATGHDVDEARIKALSTALEGVNIDEAISKAAMPTAIAVAAPVAEKKEEKASAEELEKKAESAAEGLSSLFG